MYKNIRNESVQVKQMSEIDIKKVKMSKNLPELNYCLRHFGKLTWKSNVTKMSKKIEFCKSETNTSFWKIF